MVQKKLKNLRKLTEAESATDEAEEGDGANCVTFN